MSYRGFKTRGEAAALATHTLNVFGEMCPGPLLKAEARVREMAPGDTLVMESDHSCTVRLLREHLRRLPCRFRVEEVGFGVWRLTIERR
ncbi:MAG TPA: sulfurtransferase TusA family protein [Symbiobacteriaceae bacterium]|nr:sulfurtransferase TusA family protein [Symbiobacteriaceae bacterium]